MGLSAKDVHATPCLNVSSPMPWVGPLWAGLCRWAEDQEKDAGPAAGIATALEFFV